jgi:hypothetical protein
LKLKVGNAENITPAFRCVSSAVAKTIRFIIAALATTHVERSIQGCVKQNGLKYCANMRIITPRLVVTQSTAAPSVG